ncbi:uncharacterized protein LOC131997038 [Stomoxys calcitrans]|nr:uncharacterized protein LOC131997038 [Stomoxys calcitrans]
MSAQNLYKCMLCKKRHALRYCPIFIQMTVEDRRVVVRQHNYCRNCLAKSHTIDDCQSADTCRKCGFRHHTMLHPRKLTFNSSSSTITTKSTSSRQQPQKKPPTLARPRRQQSTSTPAQRKQPAKSRLGQRQHTASAGQQQRQPKKRYRSQS